MGQVTSGFPTTRCQDPFSRREIEILGLIHQGLSNDEIARQLYLSLETVKWYNKQIYGKLGVNSRTQAIARTRETGLIEAWNSVPVPTHPRPKHNLPAPLNATIGRQQEQADLRRLLMAEMPRLVTLVGFGGVGKTRLALETAAQVVEAYPQGVWWVGLASLADGGLVAGAVAALFGLQQEQERPLEVVLQDYLHSRHILLVLDNCEHLVETCARLAEDLLCACPKLHILVTSRENLGCAGEMVYPVPTLSLPQDGGENSLDELSNREAVQLFIARAQSVAPTITLTKANAPHIINICRKLDGIPLAIELAAARLNVLSIEQLANRLDESFGVLTSFSHTALPRHQTMQACLDWSYSLLYESERTLLRRLTVFSGGCTLEAAEAVCSDETLPAPDVLDVLAGLVQKSLVTVDPCSSCEPRYYLHEIIRQYTNEKLLISCDDDFTSEQHLNYYLMFMKRYKTKLRSPEWLISQKQLKPEWDNLRAALRWSLSEERVGHAEKGLFLANAFCWVLPHNARSWAENLGWLEKGLASITGRNDEINLLRAEALIHTGNMIYSLGNWASEAEKSASAVLEEGLALYLANPQTEMSDLAWAYDCLAGVYRYSFDAVEARKLTLESVAFSRAVGLSGQWQLAKSLMMDGWGAFWNRDFDAALARGQESITLCDQIDACIDKVWSLELIGIVFQTRGDYVNAYHYIQEGLDNLQQAEQIFPEVIQPFTIRLSRNLARLDRLMGSHDAANLHMHEILSYFRDVGYWPGIVMSLLEWGNIKLIQDDYKQASGYLRESLILARDMKSEFLIRVIIASIAEVIRRQGQLKMAAILLEVGESILSGWGPYHDVYCKSLQAVQSALDQSSFIEAFAEGQKMMLEQAVAYALIMVAPENDELGS